MSVHVTSAVWKRSEAEGTTRLVLLRLADQANDDGWCWPALKALAADCRVSVSSVQRALEALAVFGELAVFRRGKRATNVYRVLVGTPEDAAAPAHLGVPSEPKVSGQVDQSPAGGEWSPVTGVSGHSCDLQTVIEPSREDTSEQVSSLQPTAEPTTVSPKPARRDLLFEAVAEVCGWDLEAVTDQARGWINGALPELRRLHATPDEVRLRARIYRANDPAGKRPTPSALVKHWPALTAATLERVDRRQLDRELAQQRSEQQLREQLEGRR